MRPALFKSVILSLFFAVFSIFSCTDIIAQPASHTNFQLLDALAKRASDSIKILLKNRNITSAVFTAEPHPALWLLKTHLAENGDFTFSNSDSAHKNFRAELFLKDFSVRYFPYADNPDSLLRTAYITLSGLTSAGFSIPEISFKSSDIISRRDIQMLEENQHSFTRAPVPPREITFWEEYGEPVLLISAAVITMALLFTVRSQ